MKRIFEFKTFATVLIAGFGLLVLTGWQLDIDWLKSLSPVGVAMNPLAAICFIASAMALHYLDPARPLVTRFLAAGVALAGLSRLVGVAGLDLEIDRLFYASRLLDNRMAPNTGLSFFFIGIALLLGSANTPRVRQYSDHFNALSLMIGLITLTGYLYRTQGLYGISTFIPMAFSTGIAFCLLSLGLFSARKNEGIGTVFSSPDLGGAMARRLLPVVVIIPLALGALRIHGQSAGWYDIETGASLLTVMTMLILALLTWKSAKDLGAIDQAYRTQSQVLESMLNERNHELMSKIGEGAKELSQARSQIEQLQKLDAVGRLAGGIAHDFNNILGAIQMHCDLVARDLYKIQGEANATTNRIHDGLRQVQKATERGAALTRQLLIFSRKKVAEPQPIQINRLLADHFKMLDRLIGEHIEISFDLSDQVPVIEADPSQIEQVMMNLVINSRDAMPNGGKISVETRYVNLTEEFASTHLSSKLGPHVLLSVSDTGCGMGDDVKPHIFDPFFTTKPVGQGTGLGLPTVYGIVKNLDGTIWVYSEPGKGTVFKIYIPASTSAAKEVQVERPTQKAGGNETVLVVEDEIDLLHLYGETLRAHGYNVLLAGDGAEALAIFSEHESRLDLLVTDMIMPKLSGAGLIKQVSARRPGLKVLCISGYPGENAEDPIHKDVRIDYLQKPFPTAELLAKVRRLLDSERGPSAAAGN